MSKWAVVHVVEFVDLGNVLKDIKKNEKSKKRVIPLPVSCFTNVQNVESFWNVPSALLIYMFAKNGSALTVENIRKGNIIVIKIHMDLKWKNETRNLYFTISRRAKMTSFIVRLATVRLALDVDSVLKNHVSASIVDCVRTVVIRLVV